MGSSRMTTRPLLLVKYSEWHELKPELGSAMSHANRYFGFLVFDESKSQEAMEEGEFFDQR
jgi:hypothetical protein